MKLALINLGDSVITK
jgi:hypothetical protein